MKNWRLKKRWRIKQRHEDCHYETIINSEDIMRPIIAYDFSQEGADSKALDEFLKIYGRKNNTEKQIDNFTQEEADSKAINNLIKEQRERNEK